MTMIMGRRAALAGLAGSSAAIAIDGGFAAVRKGAAAKPASRFDKTLAEFADELLRLSPISATSLGVDSGKNADLRARLGDGSPVGRQVFAAQMGSMLGRLKTVDAAKLAPHQRIVRDTVEYATTRGQDGAKFFYGGGASDGFFGGATPYVLTQQNGLLTFIPEFLNSQHPVKSSADAEAYLSRIAAIGKSLDEESAQLTADAGRGVMPPDYVAANALGQLKAYRATAAAEQPMVDSLAKRAKAAGLAGDWAERATKLVETMVYPALDRQIAAFEASTKNAPHTASIQRLPDGDAYYAYALKLGTTTDVPAAEIHATGLKQNDEIKARIDEILKSQGMTQGSVGERVVSLNSDPRFLFPNTDQGRTDLIAYIKGKIAASRALLPRFSHMPMKAPVDVRRVPPDIQDGAALGYMNFASLDGSRPAIYYVNLKTTNLWPKYQLATLSAHEALPGHAWQGAYLAEHHNEVPLISSMMGFNAFVEGWALYAEQLMDELGLYKDDPFGRVGYLQAQQFRACRLVVDTGLHALGWSREKAIEFMVTETGKGKDAMTSEVDRYSVSPGQACGYKMGHNQIVGLRNKARDTLGKRFDLAAFNDVVVQTGGVPLTLLGGVVDRFIAGGGKA